MNVSRNKQRLAITIGFKALIFGSLFTSWALAEEGFLTVEQAVSTAISSNPGLAEMQARYMAVSEIPSQASTLPDPVITFGAMNFPTDSWERDQEPMTQLQVGISQEFPYPGKLDLKEEAAEFDVLAASHMVDEMRLKLASNIRKRWWQLFYLDRAIETVNSSQDLLKQFIEVAKTKYETGKGLQQDVLLAQLELSKLIDKEIQIESMRRQHAIQLNTMMDISPNSSVRLPRGINNSLPSIQDESELYHLAEIRRPLLKQKESNVLASEARLKLSKRNEYPDFNVAVNYGFRSGDNPMPMGGERSDFMSVMVGVKVPLYSGRKQTKSIRQKSSELQKSRYAFLDEKGRILAEISSAVTDFNRAKAQLALFDTGIVPQARQTVQSMLAGYQVSKVDFLNLVRSQITLLNYELQYWKSLSEAKQSLARLQAAVGEEGIYE